MKMELPIPKFVEAATLEHKANCLWYERGKDKDSTTFEQVRKLPYEAVKDHPLYKCVICTGYTEGCKEYYVIDKDKGEK